jgi:hypothetical protein
VALLLVRVCARVYIKEEERKKKRNECRQDERQAIKNPKKKKEKNMRKKEHNKKNIMTSFSLFFRSLVRANFVFYLSSNV